MSFFFRKSAQLGPIRVNFSKHGIGASVGVRGFRVGIDSGGRQYVHAGGGGVYFKETLGSLSPKPIPTVPPTSFRSSNRTHSEFVAHGSSHATDGADELSASISNAAKQVAATPVAVVTAILCAILSFAALTATPTEVKICIPALLLPSAFWLVWHAMQYDESRKVVLNYEFDGDSWTHWLGFVSALNRLRQTHCKVLTAGAQVYDRKYHGGAGMVIDTRSARLVESKPLPFVNCNIDIPAFEPISGAVYRFLPDRILLEQDRQFTSIDYSELKLNGGRERIIEQSVPPRGNVVGQTWRYTNRNGGPDRRFKDNPQLPIVEYALLQITTERGMDHAILVTEEEVAAGFARAIIAMSANRMSHLARIVYHESSTDVEKRDDAAVEKPADKSQATLADTPVVRNAALFECVFDAVCCVAVADDMVCKEEAKSISKIMARIRSPWNAAQIASRFSEFRNRVKEKGVDDVIDETKLSLSRLLSDRQRRATFSCLKTVAESDGQLGEAEKNVIRRLLSIQ